MSGNVIKSFREKTVKSVSGATLLGVAVLFIVMAFPQSVNATFGSLSSNASTTYNTSGTTNYGIPNHHNSSGDGFIQDLGTNISGFMTGYTIWVEAKGADNRNKIDLWECDDENYASSTGCALAYSEYHNISTTTTYFTGVVGQGSFQECYGTTCSDPNAITFDPTKYYFVNFGENTSSISIRRIKSSTLDTYQYGDCHRNCNGSTDLTFSINGTADNGGTFTIGNINQDVITGFSSPYQTRFLDIRSNIQATGTARVIADFYIDPDEFDSSNPLYNAELINFAYVKKPDTNISKQGEEILPEGTTGTSTERTDISVTDGTYEVLITFGNLGEVFGGQQPFPEAYAYYTFEVVNGGTGIIQKEEEFYDNRTPINTTANQTCSIGNISGCLINAFNFLFIPSTDSLNNFTALNDTISTKFPFAYLYDVKDLFTTLYTSPQTVSAEITVPFSTFGNITLISDDMIADVPYAPIFKVLFVYLLWFMTAMHLYRRTLLFLNREQATV